jgi:hypothetical protein
VLSYRVMLATKWRIISAMLAPAGWLNRVSTRSCLVTRSTFGLSIFTSVLPAATRSAFESTDRGGFLAVAAIDGTLRRDDVFDLALPFLGAALSRLRDFNGQAFLTEMSQSCRGVRILGFAA